MSHLDSKSKVLSKVMQKKRQAHDRIIQASAKRLKDDIAGQKALQGSAEEKDGEEEGGGGAPRGRRSVAAGATGDGPDKGSDAKDEYSEEERVEEDEETEKGRKKKANFSLQGAVNSNKYRDEAFYVPSMPSTRHAEQGYSLGGTVGRSQAFDDMVLDLVPDDDDGDRRKRANYHWDKKKKKYIKLQPGEELRADGKRSLKNESGARV